MLDALRAKFTQHEGLKSKLLATGDARLVEHTKNDSYWADGGDGTGRNRLGELLMKVRAELRST
jgi:N-glycosidase YbiA